ncbi:hypothetical protein C8035_v006029 [Colletotrichum spinosum]|uniref:Uncharacterized protein n=1 Tax=Colletotrichum spinosum TaxID=1347390 RepID=A0A4R8QAV5_9PEZI|nr:hypothetical protein C8035_v006029 [Colletotrichum spinosum]
MRALYRFEIYCNLFKEPEVVRFNLDVVNFQRVHFFDTLSPWEIEQLVAARDFLAAAIIGPPLHALAELSKLQGLSGHQGASRSEPEMSDWTGPLLSVNLARENCHIKQNQARILCFGLRFLHKVWVTPVTQFDKVLLELPQQPRYASYNRVGEIYVWFCDAVNKSTELNNFDLPTENRLCRYTPAEYAEHVRKSAVDHDDDTGPEEAWYWAYNSFRGVENNDPRMINCRLFGMFFWDSARLHDVNFFTRVDFWWWRWEGGRQRDFEWETGPTQVQRFL